MGKYPLRKSFKFALTGIFYAFISQRNMRIHMLTTLLVILLGLYFKISPVEWLIISIAITMVLAAETINTAVETLVDLYTQDYHPLAKRAKDLAAGAVLFTAVNAVIIGSLIFIPYFFQGAGK